MEQNQEQLLIEHLDNSLLGKGSFEMEQLISDDPETAREWHYLRLAVDAVQDAGLNEQVTAVKSMWWARQSSTAKPSGALIRSIYRNVLKVAACIFLLAGGAAFYKYTMTSSAGIYEKNYSSYVLNTSRGTGTQDAMEKAYNNKNWATVISLFNTEKEKNNKSYFLTGMAELELKKYDEAIDKFQQVVAVNAQSGGDYFQDEAEFYLAMSLLASNDVNKAIPILEKIKADKSHLYHDRVTKMSSLDIRIVQYKNHK